MRRFAQPIGQARAGWRLVSTVLVIMLSTIGVAACASTPTQPPTESVAASAPAAAPSTSMVPPGSPVPSRVELGVDACKLLPPALLSKILGGEIAFAKPVPRGGWATGQCAWNGEASSFIVRVGTAASITAFGDPGAPDAKELLAAFKQQATAVGTPTDVSGIGDGAVLGSGGMAAYLGGTYVEITRLRLTDDQLAEIMRLAVANL